MFSKTAKIGMSLIVMSIKLMSWIGRSIEVVTVIYIFVRSFKLWSSVFASYIKPITISVRTQTTTRGEAGVSQLIQESITSTVTRHVKYCELNVWNKICNVRTRSLNVQTSSKQHDLWFLKLSGKKCIWKVWRDFTTIRFRIELDLTLSEVFSNFKPW